MIRTKPTGVLGALALGVWMAMAGVTAYAQTVTTAVLSKGFAGGKPTSVTNTFKPGDRKIHAYVRFSKPYKCTMRSAWYAVSAEGIKANTKVYEMSLKRNNYISGHFQLENSTLWPKGKYRVDVFANAKKIRSLHFTVK